MRRTVLRTSLLCAGLSALIGCVDQGGGASGPEAVVDLGQTDAPPASDRASDRAMGDRTAATDDASARLQDGPPSLDGPDQALPGDCVPDRQVWESGVSDVVAARCGTCHGETPIYGAAHTLTDYDSLLSGPPGSRLVDRLYARVDVGTMPPRSQPLLTLHDREALLSWASCRAENPDPPSGPAGLEVSADPLPAPAEAPVGLPFFDVVANEYALGQDDRNPYICFAFTVPGQGDRFIRRIEPVLDDARVVHHFVLMKGPADAPDGVAFDCGGIFENWVYAWGPGMGALQFPQGGVRTSGGERFLLQIHYNNGGGFADVRDSSGVRVYHADPVGPEYGLTALGNTGFELAANTRTTVESWCTLPVAVDVLSSWPHMHELGYALESTLLRADGEEEPLISLRGWNFEAQFLYDTPVRLEAGDAIHTSCTFDNISGRDVRFGPRTEDEMCFNFLYTTPPVGSPFCNGGPPPQAAPTPQIPGDCASPDEEPLARTWVDGQVLEGRVPALEGDGRYNAGRWRLTGGDVFMARFDTPLGRIDAATSRILARGYARLEADLRVYFDFETTVHVALDSGQMFDAPLSSSISGEAIPGDLNTPAHLTADCGNLIGEADFIVDLAEDGLTPELRATASANIGGLPIDFLFRFAPEP